MFRTIFTTLRALSLQLNCTSDLTPRHTVFCHNHSVKFSCYTDTFLMTKNSSAEVGGTCLVEKYLTPSLSLFSTCATSVNWNFLFIGIWLPLLNIHPVDKISIASCACWQRELFDLFVAGKYLFSVWEPAQLVIREWAHRRGHTFSTHW